MVKSDKHFQIFVFSALCGLLVVAIFSGASNCVGLSFFFSGLGKQKHSCCMEIHGSLQFFNFQKLRNYNVLHSQSAPMFPMFFKHWRLTMLNWRYIALNGANKKHWIRTLLGASMKCHWTNVLCSKQHGSFLQQSKAAKTAKSRETSPTLSPARCGISCKFCNVANYIVHCLNAHLMVGEFIILYSCEIQSSGGKFKTSFINRIWKIKGKVLFYCESPLTHTQE